MKVIRFVFWVLVGAVLFLLYIPVGCLIDGISEKLTRRAVFIHGLVYTDRDTTPWVSYLYRLMTKSK